MSGTSDYLRNDLNSSMSLVGRIPPKTTWDYIEKISKNPQKEILVLRFGPQNNDEVTYLSGIRILLNSTFRSLPMNPFLNTCQRRIVLEWWATPVKW